ncbi:fimbria/pilus outer membrane usher protein [Paraburkholderia tagetis]|uniref:Fimbria/pilus outer membrane usher protein n=1 Tax=Paraburkholderia tagetis TaxID=2913261 RepID=A0A9X1RUE4_9BURK|nr:fimbria/pilus outer membrane usher protein [Paraburkholderia tagetis]MCG5077090.1 fimbria/pilus outer membrane usher protein [Paraburkholderia tagetis]
MMMSSLHAQTNRPINTPEVIAVTINGEEVADFASVLRTNDGKIFLSENLLPKVRLNIVNAEIFTVDGNEYYRIDNLPNTQVTFDDATQTLHIVASGPAFNATTYSIGGQQRRNVQEPAIGGYLNYDMTYSKASNNYNFGALLDANVFGISGGEFEIREIYRQTSVINSLYRLDTKYVKDFPDSVATLTLGDSSTVSSNWSNQVYFGGIQYNTNFSIRPDIISTPLPTLSGVAQAPSTVNIYVDSVLRSSTNVNTGPFALSNVPVFTGQGNVQMVVQDALGRQQVISQPFINSALMLREGTHAESVEAGLLRENYGLANSRYAQAFASGTYREGFKYATVETHAEVAVRGQDLGVGSTFPLLNSVILTTSVAGSTSEYGSGGLAQVQLSHQSRYFSVSASDTVATKNYWQLGYGNGNRPASHEFIAQGSLSPWSRVSLSLSYLNDANRDLPNIKTVAAGLTFDLRHYGSVSFSVSKGLSSIRTTTAGALWVIPFGHQSVATGQIDFAPHNTVANFEVSKTPDLEGGWGYRARTTALNDDSQDVGVTYLSKFGQFELDANHIAGQVNEQVDATGGIAVLGGIVRPTRWIDSSFAMVEVPLKQTVDVYSNNRVIGHTDGSGIALLPNLVAYENNSIHLDDSEIPLDVTLDLAERTVTPPKKGGYLLKFEAKKVSGATIILVDERHQPLPAGAVVRVGDQASEQIALNGEVFMPDIVLPATVTATWGAMRCTAKALAPASQIVLPTVGPFVCVAQK